MVTIVNNPKGTFKANFGRVDEQAFFVVPNVSPDVILPHPVTTSAVDDTDELDNRLIRKLLDLGQFDLDAILNDDRLFDPDENERLAEALDDVSDLTEAEGEDPGEVDDSVPPPPDYEDWFLRRRGQESSYRKQRPNQFYAILIDERARKVVGIGPHLEKEAPYEVTREGDIVTVYPIDSEHHERVWRYSRTTMQQYIDAGEILVGKYNEKTASWTLNHRKLKKDVRRYKTVWWDKSHDAGVHGTNVVNAFLGRRGLFPFPKSVYAVRDCLAAVVRNRPNALIVDFFAGSGTTFHATCLLNAKDGGRRRSILEGVRNALLLVDSQGATTVPWWR